MVPLVGIMTRELHFELERQLFIFHVFVTCTFQKSQKDYHVYRFTENILK